MINQGANKEEPMFKELFEVSKQMTKKFGDLLEEQGKRISQHHENQLLLAVMTAMGGMDAVLETWPEPVADQPCIQSRAGKGRVIDIAANNRAFGAAAWAAAEKGLGIDFRSESNFDRISNQGEIVGRGEPKAVLLIDQLDGTTKTTADPRGLPKAATVVAIAPADHPTYQNITVGALAQPLASDIRSVYVGIGLEDGPTETFLAQNGEVKQFESKNHSSKLIYVPHYGSPEFAPLAGFIERDIREKLGIKTYEGNGASAPDLREICDANLGGYVDVRATGVEKLDSNRAKLYPYDVAGALKVLEGTEDEGHKVFILDSKGDKLDFELVPYGPGKKGIDVIALRLPSDKAYLKDKIVQFCERYLSQEKVEKIKSLT